MKKYLILLALLIIGVTAHSQVMLNKATKYLGITTTVRNSLTINANEFPVIYNTTTGQFERYNGATWEKWVAGVAEADIVDLQTYTLPADFDTFAELDALVADKSLVNTADAQTLTNKTVDDNTFYIQDNLDDTKKIQFQASGLTTGQTRIITVPNANGTLSMVQLSETLLNKTISGSANTLSNITSAAITDGTIDELDLDASVNASLDSADSALQSGDVTAATVDAGVSTDGHVLTSDGLGGAAWEAASGSGESTTVSDTGEIDLTLTGSDISGALITGSIDVLKLDSGVQTSLGLADSASQTDDQTAAEVTIADAGALITATTVEGALAENRTAIDLNTAKVTNATHTGDVTGSVDLTIADNAIDENMLNALNVPTDEYVLTYESASSQFEWQAAAFTPEDVAYTSAWNGDPDATSKNTIWDAFFVQSDTVGIANSTQITNMFAITQAGYDVLTPADDVLYVITDAVDEHKFIIPLGGSTTDLAVADDVTHIPILDAITITRIEADVLTAPTGTGITLDIELDDGTPASILSTLLTIDATERFTSTAAIPAVVSDATIPADSFLTFNVDVIGSTIAGAGGTVTIYYTID